MSLFDKVFSGKPSQQEFAEMVAKAFEKSGFANLEYKEEDFALKVPGKDSTVFLGNAYTNYCNVPRSERSAIVERLVSSITATPEIPSSFGAAKPALMPMVRDAAYFSLIALLARKSKHDKEDVDLQGKALAQGLVVGLAYDGEQTITSVNRRQLTDWGVGLDEAFAAAKDNLWEKTDPSRLVGHSDGVYVGQWGDSYDSSRILLTELIYRLSVNGDPVAYVPNRDSLWVTGKNDRAGLTTILKAGSESHFKQGHPVSPDLYVLEDGKWSVYAPEDAALREMWLATRRHRSAIDYDQQKKIIDELHEQDGTDIFVAGYKLLERKDGKTFGVCVWTKDVDSSLPQADNIGFVVDPEAGDMFMVPWDKAVPIVGSLMEEEPEFVPVRYRVREFPSDGQVMELRKLAV